jgi:hypothetical protein
MPPHDARRTLFARLIDDAGLFPPARKAMEQAVADHRAARAGEHAWMLGRFLSPASRLAELADAGPDDDWALGVIADGADWRAALEAVRSYDAAGKVDAIELRLPSEPLLDVLAGVGDDVEVFFEVPTDDRSEMSAALDAIAASGRAGAKIRCGGLTPAAFPADEAVSRFVADCARLGVAFKATAGLHHPFRTRDESLGVLQHGFLNLLAASAFPSPEPTVIVGEPDPRAFTLDSMGLWWRDRFADAEATKRARALFTAYGSCSFAEPVDDLTAYGLLDPASARA